MSLNLICSLDCWEGRVTYSGYPGACKGQGGHNLIVEGQGRGLGLLKIESRIDTRAREDRRGSQGRVGTDIFSQGQSSVENSPKTHCKFHSGLLVRQFSGFNRNSQICSEGRKGHIWGQKGNII